MHSIHARIAVATAFVFCFVAGVAQAAVDPNTGIDWAEVGSDTLSSAKPAILAGLAIMVVLLAVTLGRKMFSKVAK